MLFLALAQPREDAMLPVIWINGAMETTPTVTIRVPGVFKVD